ncbi:MAG: hypothetical protein R2751_01315 [Bacteroidales bacterium]
MKTKITLALVAILLGASAAFTDYGKHNGSYPEWKTRSERADGSRQKVVSAPFLARMLFDREPGLVLLDLRSEKAFASYHIPGSWQPADVRESGLVEGADLLVLIGDSTLNQRKLAGEMSVIPDGFDGRILVLEDGMTAWTDEVLFPDMLQWKVRSGQRLNEIHVLSHYFGGSPRNSQWMQVRQADSPFREGC